MKIKFLFIAFLLSATAINAQEEDDDGQNVFNHLAVSVNFGTPGIGFDLAAPICNYVEMRAGVTFMPHFKYDTDLDIETPNIEGYDFPDEVKVQGKLGFTNGEVLFDVFPTKKTGFHITVGAFFGSSEVINVYNKEDGFLSDISEFNNMVENGEIEHEKIGVILDDYLLEPDDNGNVNAYIKTRKFKPYVGLGWGRAVPKKRVNFGFDLGVQFWGTPKVYCNGLELTEENLDGDDGGIIKTISKITVYPVLRFRISGRIF